MRLSLELSLAAAVIAVTAFQGEARLSLRDNSKEENQDWPDWGNFNPNDESNCYQPLKCNLTACGSECNCYTADCDMPACTNLCNCIGGQCDQSACTVDCTCFGGYCDQSKCTKNCGCSAGHCDQSSCIENCDCLGGSCGPEAHIVEEA
ncbi:hypothetical protein ACHAXN_010767 [Cyclotella atomus]